MLKKRLGDAAIKKAEKSKVREQFIEGVKKAVNYFHLENVAVHAGEMSLYGHYKEFRYEIGTPEKGNVYLSVINSHEADEFYCINLVNKNVKVDYSGDLIQGNEFENVVELVNEVEGKAYEFADDVFGLDGYSVLYLSYIDEMKTYLRWCPNYNSNERGLSAFNHLHSNLKTLKVDKSKKRRAERRATREETFEQSQSKPKESALGKILLKFKNLWSR